MKKLISAILILIIGNVHAQGDLNSRVTSIINNYKVHPSSIGIHAKFVENNKSLVSINESNYFIPASSLKVITTFTALDLLGFDYKYETKIGYTGSLLGDGTLTGDLWIIGSGDPSLGSFRKDISQPYNFLIDNIVKTIQDAGITCIDGKIVVDASRYDKEGVLPSWSWNDVANYYGGGSYGLNINENEFEIFFNRNRKLGEMVNVEYIFPKIPNLSIDSRVFLDKEGSGDNAYIYGGPDHYHKVIKGSIPAGKGLFKIRGAIPNPPLFMAQGLYSALHKENISAQGCAEEILDKNIKLIPLKSYYSKNLAELVKVANDKSINLYCESFFKSISPNEGSRSQASSIIKKHHNSIGLDTMDLIQIDGSGLSSRNVITPRYFTAFLQYYYKKWGETSLNLLPKASEEGTVRGLLRNKKSKGKAWLKSGYISDVLTYTGYLKDKNGKILSLTIMVNNYTIKTSKVRQMAEDIIDILYLQ